MDDTDTESAETDPLVRHGETTTGVSGGATPGGTTTEGGGSSRRPAPGNPPPPRTSSRHYMDAKPRLSLVPETSERSTEEDQEEPHDAEGKKRKCHLESPTPLCPFFGVRNYLHQFYEKQDINDPALYENLQPDEQVYLVKQTDGGCSSYVFRISLILGGLLLLLGVVAFIIAACAARRTVTVTQTGGVPKVNTVNSSHNAQVDALLLVGLVAVTLGSTVIAASLISRTFCSRTEEYPYPYPFRAGQFVLEPPWSPTESKVPVTEKLTQVQPAWDASGMTVKGMIPLP